MLVIRESDFPSFLEGLSLREPKPKGTRKCWHRFPFLFGRAFIEGSKKKTKGVSGGNFPSFLEGLSLRVRRLSDGEISSIKFPFLFGRAFIEGPP